ncbi:MAG: poly-gamma-glutamate synthase PgsB [Bacteroidetes bacterium]|nr:poly-gamma-glutamate synthase PgsB [Bacteroidota bacterium]MBT7143523.1 poly-gamma-glutamate synthase PgsB [Bacteroidota bacterium]
MYIFYILLVMAFAATVFGLIEYNRHQKRIYSIPMRIHVNGTRGKSSVTRLIGAGLRAGGISTITKVTGTFPRLILEDGTETFIHRKSDPNILEQLSIVKFASRRKVRALVMECMALQPQFQSITENQMIHANVGVMTNVRLDHVDIMGHTLSEIAETLGRTIPKNESFFSSENVIPHTLKEIADKRNSKSFFIETKTVSPDEMQGFSYIEHRDNVALALSVCQHLKIDRETALKGMYEAVPDAGALRCHQVEAFKKQLFFYNAFAANDPDSTFMIWKIIQEEIGLEGTRIILLNTRQDRLDRARQLAELSGGKLANEIDCLMLIGQSTEVVENMTVGYGLPKNKIINLGLTTPQNVFEKVLSITDKKSTILAIGNMGGMGAETAEFFENRSSTNYD